MNKLIKLIKTLYNENVRHFVYKIKAPTFAFRSWGLKVDYSEVSSCFTSFSLSSTVSIMPSLVALNSLIITSIWL